MGFEPSEGVFADFSWAFIDVVDDVFIQQSQHGFCVVVVEGFEVGGDQIAGAWHGEIMAWTF